MSESLVSVIIPAYNHEKYVQETIKSIIDQTYKNIELIIVDDGSPDSTLEKINEMKEICEKRFVRFVVETQENKGTCLTLNRLLKLSQGEYVYLIASDDNAAPEAIETLHDFLSKYDNYALAMGENLIMDQDGKHCWWDKNRKNVYNLEEVYFTSFSDYISKAINLNLQSETFGCYSLLLFGNHVLNGYLIRKSIFEKVGYFTPEAPLEDYYLMLQVSKYSKIKHLPKPLFYYRWHDSNTVKDIAKASEMTRKTIAYEYEKIIKSGDPALIKVLQDHLEVKLKQQQAKVAAQ